MYIAMCGLLWVYRYVWHVCVIACSAVAGSIVALWFELLRCPKVCCALCVGGVCRVL